MDKEKQKVVNEQTGKQITENIWQGTDGVYRWAYEYDMLRNPGIMFTVWKVLGISFGIVFLFITVLDLFEGFTLEKLQGTGKLFLILAAVFLVISILAYLIVAWMYGWKYQVLFEMDEEQVIHRQLPKQYKRAEAVGWVTFFAGLMTGNAAMAGLGLHNASNNTSTSVFGAVKTVKIRPRLHTIHVNQLLEKNQVYAEDADFEFVKNYILEHCTGAKIR